MVEVPSSKTVVGPDLDFEWQLSAAFLKTVDKPRTRTKTNLIYIYLELKTVKKITFPVVRLVTSLLKITVLTSIGPWKPHPDFQRSFSCHPEQGKSNTSLLLFQCSLSGKLNFGLSYGILHYVPVSEFLPPFCGF